MNQTKEPPRRLSLAEFDRLTHKIDLDQVDDVEGDFSLTDVIWQIQQSLFWEACAAGQARLAEQGKN